MDIALRVADSVTMMHDGSVVIEGARDPGLELIQALYLGSEHAWPWPSRTSTPGTAARTSCRARRSPWVTSLSPSSDATAWASPRCAAPSSGSSTPSPAELITGSVRLAGEELVERQYGSPRRHRLRAARAAHLPVAERPRAPADGGPARVELVPTGSTSSGPGSPGATRSAAARFRWRAADARDRPCAADGSPHRDHGRALRGPGADGGRRADGARARRLRGLADPPRRARTSASRRAWPTSCW